MVTLAEPGTREELSRIVEDVELNASLEEFIRSLSLSDHEENVIIDSLQELPDRHTNPDGLPKNSPDLIRMNWWM